MTRILVTGFEPFADSPANSSWQACEELARQWSGPEELHIRRLPVIFGQAARELHRAIAELDPTIVIATGMAEGRAEVTPERIAVNLDDARIPDNEGARPLDAPIDPEGPAAYFSTLPITTIVAALQKAGIAASVSGTAGSFVCNHVFYALQAVTAAQPGRRSGFVHLPATGECGFPPEVPVLGAEVLGRALGIIVRTAIDTAPDARPPGGSEH